MIPPPAPPAAVPALVSWAGAWGRPPDRPAMVALGMAVGLLIAAAAPAGPQRVASLLEAWGVADVARRRRFVVITAFAAAFLSLGYLSFYLRGGPRAPEAAVYWLQGRALSHGALQWPVPNPTASFRAPAFAFTPPNRLAAPFAPGFPLLLSIGFLLGAPMIVGPLLAAALARTAAGLSVLSVALRFQTGEALPHGEAALAVTMALVCAMRARRTADA